MRRVGLRIAAIACAAGLLGACSAVPTLDRQEQREYFSEAEYGQASPRLVSFGRRVPKGGGRYQVGKPYTVAGRTFVPREQPGYSATGKASWYGAAFHGRKTANGEVYDMNAYTAAHPTLPLPSYVRVTNLDNGRSLVVRVNDRGPFAHGRIIDLSKAAATKLGYKAVGTADVRVDYIGPADLDGRDGRMLAASYAEPGRRARTFVAPVQVAQAQPPARMLHDATGSGGAALTAPSIYGSEDLIGPLILGRGGLSAFAPANPAPRTPALDAVEDLAH